MIFPLRAAMTGLACLMVAGAAPALAQSTEASAPSPTMKLAHAIDYASITIQAPATTAAPQRPEAFVAAASGAPETPVARDGAAADAASPAAATAGTTCEAYFTQSRDLDTILGPAFAAISQRDIISLTKQLPALQAALDALPAAEIKAEACNDHINAYTSYQFAELMTLRNHGVSNGLPNNLVIVKQPDLNQAPLAFAVGWTRFEQQDYAGAAAADLKGLTLYPQDHGLQAEYMADLSRQSRWSDLLVFCDHVLETGLDMNDEVRGKTYGACGLALANLGQFAEADTALSVSLRYHEDADIRALQTQLKTLMGTKP